jgi:OmpA-OmpF porin, OOP family
MERSFIFAAMLAAAAFSTSAFAAEDNAVFIRAEAGNSNISISGADDDDTSYGVRGGYFFNGNFGVEAFYSRIGEESGDGVSADLDSYGIGVIGKKNMTAAHKGFYLDGRIGVARTTVDVGIAGLGSVDDSSNRVYLGAGAGYDFNQSMGLSLNLVHQRPSVFGEQTRLTTATLAFEVRF